MSIFEVVFNFVGLVLGFALVEVLSGLARTLRSRSSLRIGWLTPLLGIWVLFDVATFWGSAWELRSLLPSVWQSLGPALVLTSLYYLAASQVFPEHLSDHQELDTHYWKVRRLTYGIVLLCNCTTWAIGLYLGRRWEPLVTTVNVMYAVTLIAVMLVPGKRLNVALQLLLIAILIECFVIP